MEISLTSEKTNIHTRVKPDFVLARKSELILAEIMATSLLTMILDQVDILRFVLMTTADHLLFQNQKQRLSETFLLRGLTFLLL
jgi:hypothetical protein